MLYCKHTFASFHATHSENQLDQESWINWTCLQHRELPGTHQLDRLHPVWPPWAVGWRQRVTLHGAAFVPVAKAAHCLYLAAGLDGLAVEGNMICGYLWISVVDTTPKKTWTILSQDWGEWAHHCLYKGVYIYIYISSFFKVYCRHSIDAGTKSCFMIDVSCLLHAPEANIQSQYPCLYVEISQ